MNELALNFKKHKFGITRLHFLKKYCEKMQDATRFMMQDEEEEYSYLKGYDKCLQDIIDSCEEILNE